MDEILESVTKKLRRTYTPVYVCDELYGVSRRIFSDQHKRLNLFPKNFNQESILDVGCNSGFFTLYLKKYHNAGFCLGIDVNDKLKEIWDRTIELEELTNLEYSIIDDEKEIQKNFDNILILSLSDINGGMGRPLDYYIDRYILLAKKSIYIEPTNHEGYKKNQIISKYQKYLAKWGKPNFLGHTDYQDRPLFRLDV